MTPIVARVTSPAGRSCASEARPLLRGEGRYARRGSARAIGPLGPSRLENGFACTILVGGGGQHGYSGRANESPAGTGAPRTSERMRALRERARRGLRRLTIEVREDDLRAIAKRGYEGAVTTDLDQQAQAVGLFLCDALLQI
jgi:hypothetical protein